jgi:hypothetical protein
MASDPAAGIDLVGVRFDGMGRSPGQAGAPQALRAAGLETALPAAELTSDVILPAPTSARGPADFISGCRGCSIGVYNADLDSGGHAAARIVAFAAGVAAHARPG